MSPLSCTGAYRHWHGALKANISTVGVYARGPGKDSAFSWFYLGINVTFTAAGRGYVGERLGWHWGFA